MTGDTSTFGGLKNKLPRLRQVEIGSPEFFPMYSLGHKHWKLPAGRRVFSQSGLHTDSIFGQIRDTTVQVWTVAKGLGIGSEFSQTCCAANNFRDHEVLLPWFKGTGD
jgi:hypothetical protein